MPLQALVIATLENSFGRRTLGLSSFKHFGPQRVFRGIAVLAPSPNLMCGANKGMGKICWCVFVFIVEYFELLYVLQFNAQSHAMPQV